MKKSNVVYQAGESRTVPGKAIDYMLATIDDIELYAEAENKTWDEETERCADESATYDELKAAIMEQAQQNGIDTGRLHFWHDDKDGGEIMNTVKIYQITRTKTYMMGEQGTGYSLHPWGNDSDHYEGCDDGGVDYIIPEGYHVAEDMTGSLHIYPIGVNYPCELVQNKDGLPTITAVTYPGYITLKRA